MIITQPKKIESALRDFLRDNKSSITREATFINELNTFDGDTTIEGKGRLIIGKWDIECSGSKATATVQKQYGGGGGEFLDEVLEVELELKDDSVVVIDWNAYHQHYTELE